VNRSYWWIIAALGLDQFSKWLVLTQMELGQSIPVIGTFFQFTSHRNRGAAFGILQNQRWFFIGFTILIVGGLFVWWWRTRKQGPAMLNLSLALIIGGAIGNWLDRLRMGEVIDFFHFHFQFNLGSLAVDYVFPLFNIADSAIVVGAFLLAWSQLKEEPEQMERSEQEGQG
jgi:signal peptidase II